MTSTSHVHFDGRWPHPYDHLTVEITHRGTPGDFAVIEEVLRGNSYHLGPDDVKDKVVIDAGAHVGTFSALALALGAKHVYAIEPNPDNRALLEDNVIRMAEKVNGTVKVEVAAVGLRSLMGPRIESVGEGANATIESGQEYSTKTGSGLTVDTRWEGGDIPVREFAEVRQAAGGMDFLKCDTEGSEYAWFSSANIEDLTAVGKIVMEWHSASKLRALLPQACEPSPLGWLCDKLAHTHAVSFFGRPADGGMLYAHAL